MHRLRLGLVLVTMSVVDGRLALCAQDSAQLGLPSRVQEQAERARRKGPGGLNEPSGFIPVSRREFLERVEEGWTDRGDAAFQIVRDPGAPMSPPDIGRARYPRGFLSGRGPILTEVELPPRSRGLYLSFWMRLSPNWVGHPTSVNKIFHLWIGGSNRVYLSAHGKGPGPYVPQVNLQGIPGPQIARDLNPRRSPRILIRRNEWVHWELILWANHQGQRDGSVEWWINGEPAGKETNFAYTAPRLRSEWERVTWNPTWGGGGPVLREPIYMDMDEVYVSVSR